MLNLFDSHTHSDNSLDGTHSVTFMCEKALQKGLMGFAVTDHCDIDLYKKNDFQLRMIQSIFEVRKARASFGPKLMLTAGIELGQPLADVELAGRAVRLQDYDFVLASMHNTPDGEDFFCKDYKTMPVGEIEELLHAYFDSLIATVKWGMFDVCAHLTYPLRYIMGRDGRSCPLGPYLDQIDQVLRALVYTGKGLECNVSGLYGDFGRTMPEMEVFHRFHDLGGELVTIGSDAHRAENIGRSIEQGMQMLARCGFDYFAFYKKRSPRMLAIR